MEVRGFLSQNINPKVTQYLLSDSYMVLVRHSQARKCLYINPKLFYEIFKNTYLTTYLSYLPMSSDKHNSRTVETIQA